LGDHRRLTVRDALIAFMAATAQAQAIIDTHCASGRQIVQRLLSVRARAAFPKSGCFGRDEACGGAPHALMPGRWIVSDPHDG
jgi:hypothetical protein